MSGLGLRSGGGLGYGEASSFSLKPLHLAWTLLPSYGLADLSVVFGTLGYTEFVAYVGLLGLALAVLGAWRGRGRARRAGLLFGLLGLFLAAGAGIRSTSCSSKSSPASTSSAPRPAG
ncbi:MAG: hypothetical protein H6644_04395 [Caldilineaceae bacterium]|nr:hypothetical protein [Caldilineaceae bacterium]